MPSRNHEKACRAENRKEAMLLVCQALFLRLLVFNAMNWLRQTTSATDDGGLEAVLRPLYALASIVQVSTLAVAFFVERARRSMPMLLLWTMSISNAVHEACQSKVVQRYFSAPEDDLEGSYLPFISASLDTQPSSIAAVPLALIFILQACGSSSLFPGILIGPSVAVVLPNLLARATALWAGFATITWSLLIRSTIAGISSSIAVLWLILDIRRMSGGRTMLNKKLPSLEETDKKSIWAYIAVRAFTNFMLLPFWCVLISFRTGVWLLTFGQVFRMC